MITNPNCICSNVSCPRHGDCEACRAKHRPGMTTCERLEAEAKAKEEQA